jgi:hypothetical protein
MLNEPVINCDAALESLQSRLDGSAQPADPAIAQHLRQCPECRSRYAAAELLLSLYEPRVPADFTVRVRSAVRTDARRRGYRRVLVSAVGLAAAIVLAIWLGMPKPEERKDLVVAANVPSLEKRLSGAKSAIWGWSGRTVSLFGMPDIAEPRINTDGLGQSMEPAASALADAGKGFVDGVEPLTSSAKRAATRFWRDLPTN